MAKTLLGIDLGADRLKLSLMKGGQIKKTAIEPVPESLVKEGRIVSIETAAELIKSTMKKNGISASDCAFVLSSENIYIRNITMPIMSHDQLLYNIPFEFRDYISNDLKDYIFDYAMISTPEELAIAQANALAAEENEEGEDKPSNDMFGASDYDEVKGAAMELTAVVAPKELINETNMLAKKLGMNLKVAAPPVSAFSNIIRHYEKLNPSEYGVKREYCILDFGYNSIRMYMFKSDTHNVTRVLEIGLSSVDQAIADAHNVDIHLAHTYLLTNHEDCQNSEVCKNAFNTIAIELMRALNFYRFSNPDSKLEDIYMCGGGSVITSLRESIGEMLDLQIHPATELLSELNLTLESNNAMLAIGIAVE